MIDFKKFILVIFALLNVSCLFSMEEDSVKKDNPEKKEKVKEAQRATSLEELVEEDQKEIYEEFIKLRSRYLSEPVPRGQVLMEEKFRADLSKYGIKIQSDPNLRANCGQNQDMDEAEEKAVLRQPKIVKPSIFSRFGAWSNGKINYLCDLASANPKGSLFLLGLSGIGGLFYGYKKNEPWIKKKANNVKKTAKFAAESVFLKCAFILEVLRDKNLSFKQKLQEIKAEGINSKNGAICALTLTGLIAGGYALKKTNDQYRVYAAGLNLAKSGYRNLLNKLFSVGAYAKENKGKTLLILSGIAGSYLLYKIYKLANADRQHSLNNVDQFLTTLSDDQLNKIKSSELHGLLALSLDNPKILAKNKDFMDLLTKEQKVHLDKVIFNYNRMPILNKQSNNESQTDNFSESSDVEIQKQVDEAIKPHYLIHPKKQQAKTESFNDSKSELDELKKIPELSEKELIELKQIFDEIMKSENSISDIDDSGKEEKDVKSELELEKENKTVSNETADLKKFGENEEEKEVNDKLNESEHFEDKASGDLELDKPAEFLE